MKALAICPQNIEIDIDRVNRALDCELQITSIKPSIFSAFTAVNIASSVAKEDIGIVIATREKDVIAAISARKISKREIERIIYIVAPNSQIPRSLPSELENGVDLWIFPSERLLNTFPGKKKEQMVISSTIGEIEHDTHSRRYIWLGPIDGNTERLKQAIEAVNACDEEATLIIYGQGKAQNVMPCVRLTRAIEHPERIVWADKDADKMALAATCKAVIQAGADPIAEEFILGQPIFELKSIKDPVK